MTEALRNYLHHSPKIAKRVMVDRSSTIIGRVDLRDDVSIWPLVVIRGDVNYIQVGARSNIQDGCILHVARKTEHNPNGYPLIIGEEVTVGHGAILHGCIIGNRTLIGMGARVLDGAKIDDNVILGAGSLVGPGKHLEKGYLYIGNPARKVRPLTEDEIQSLAVSAQNYVILKDEYLED
ncbi:gamma carbonic anhydrase family protein [Pragia fontium]|uniref:Carbonic anhydrase or acetyltransferase, isoleucine patch superfamily n=2 Tax=Pragia fontium TaxID=82985 RepID=A0AAJ5BIB8_9GAMM|nr:gamma carbonic anhydrase family protein [Pragia fontium]AKJ40985.1 anhydrase [Pragia fontium]SFD27072.1 Carbonic anhydrase or acetyltransferase, isoleucine patch superfamily [Pragia fontium DSM 5563 = ATCC 49100]SUB81177.1 carnitine operon protein CaiE [Pragia fontium]VEJ53199.1 carnitine operon protein CaiE [Pragia fontium]GKX64619.1 transferase [Pragia fontium]